MLKQKKNCKSCNSEFYSSDRRKIFCSVKCVKTFHGKLRNRVFIRLEERSCVWCKSKFMPNTNKNTYCSKECVIKSQAYKYPDKVKARKLLGYAISAGIVTKSFFCEKCFKSCNPHGHHDDYSKPMNVIWLCPKCHRRLHVSLMDRKKSYANIN